MTNIRTALIASLLLIAACGSKKKEAPAVKIDPAAVNALVPKNLADKLVFEEKSVTEERGRKSTTTYTMAAPKTWNNDSKMFAKFRPSDGEGYGNFTEISVGSNCDGACEAKDWAATSDKVDFKQFKDGFKIIKDEKTATSRLVVASNDDTTYISYAWWVDGADHYNTCRVALMKGFRDDAPDPRPAALAFEKACQAVNVATN